MTARAQPGNDRAADVPADGGPGAGQPDGVQQRGGGRGRHPTGRRPRSPIVGVNIGKTKAVPDDEAAADYAASARAVALGVANYVVVNVSSPNTPGLRDLQATERLRPVLVAVREALDAAAAGRRVPLLVKIAPDLRRRGRQRRSRTSPSSSGSTGSSRPIRPSPVMVWPVPRPRWRPRGAGGLSGPPLGARALAVVRRVPGARRGPPGADHGRRDRDPG